MIHKFLNCYSGGCGYTPDQDENNVQEEHKTWAELRVQQWCSSGAESPTVFCEVDEIEHSPQTDLRKYPMAAAGPSAAHSPFPSSPHTPREHEVDMSEQEVSEVDLPVKYGFPATKYPNAARNVQSQGFLQAQGSGKDKPELVFDDMPEVRPSPRSFSRSHDMQTPPATKGDTPESCSSVHSIKPILPGSVTESERSEYNGHEIGASPVSVRQSAAEAEEVPDFPRLAPPPEPQHVTKSPSFDEIDCFVPSASSSQHPATVGEAEDNTQKDKAEPAPECKNRTVKRESGDLYEGQIVMGKAHGEGVLHYSSGSFYEGQFEQDRVHGQGMRRHKDGSVYDGQWLDDKKHGMGVDRSPRGTRFEGYFEYGLKQGSGRVDFRDGSTYEGQFQNGTMHGEGKFTHDVNGSAHFYKGMWANGKQDGLGMYGDASSGQMRQGEWDQGVLVRWLSVITTMEYHNPEDEEEARKEGWKTKAAQGAGVVAQRARGSVNAVAAAGGAVAGGVGVATAGVVGVTGMVGGAGKWLASSLSPALKTPRKKENSDDDSDDGESQESASDAESDSGAQSSPRDGVFISRTDLRVQTPTVVSSADCNSPQHTQQHREPAETPASQPEVKSNTNGSTPERTYSEWDPCEE